MKAAERPKSLDALPNFIVEHDECEKGFDIDHPAGLGAGVIRMTCRSCGGRFEFLPTTIEIEREIQLKPPGSKAIELESRPAEAVAADPPGPANEAMPAEPPLPLSLHPAADPNGGDGGFPAPPKRRSSSSRRDRIIVALLLLFAVAAFTFAVVRVLNEREGSSATEPTPASNPTPASAPAAAKPAAKPAAVKRLQLAGASITVPLAWAQSTAGGRTMVAPPAPGAVSIRIFDSPNPRLEPRRLISRTGAFLSSEVPNGAPGPARRTTIAGRPAFELSESGPRGSQEALVILSGPRRFLLVGTARAGASAAEKADLRGALRSFRPD